MHLLIYSQCRARQCSSQNIILRLARLHTFATSSNIVSVVNVTHGNFNIDTTSASDPEVPQDIRAASFSKYQTQSNGKQTQIATIEAKLPPLHDHINNINTTTQHQQQQQHNTTTQYTAGERGHALVSALSHFSIH
ncbi:unnamed protein product [Arctogadus glacialis]